MIGKLTSSKRFWITVFLLVLIIMGGMVFITNMENEVEISDVEVQKEIKPAAKVDFGNYKESFSESDQKIITETFSQRVDNENFQGLVRDGSYKESIVDNTPVKQMLIDVIQIKKTFLVYKSEGGAGGQNILYVRCASQDSQREPSWECTDEI